MALNTTNRPDEASGASRPGIGEVVDRRTANYYTGIDWVGLLLRLAEKIHWILLAALVGAAVAGVWAFIVATPVYQATAKLYMVGTETTISMADLQLGSSLAADYQEVFKNHHVHALVRSRLNLNYSDQQIGGMISVLNPDGTHVLYVNARSSDPQEARMLADTYAQVAREYIAKTMDVREPNDFEEAQTPTAPIWPNKKRAVAMGFFGGALLAAVLLALILVVDDRVLSPEDVSRVSGLPTLGVIPLQEQPGRAGGAKGAPPKRQEKR